jgi:hypothetical protein
MALGRAVRDRRMGPRGGIGGRQRALDSETHAGHHMRVAVGEARSAGHSKMNCRALSAKGCAKLDRQESAPSSRNGGQGSSGAKRDEIVLGNYEHID